MDLADRARLENNVRDLIRTQVRLPQSKSEVKVFLERTLRLMKQPHWTTFELQLIARIEEEQCKLFNYKRKPRRNGGARGSTKIDTDTDDKALVEECGRLIPPDDPLLLPEMDELLTVLRSIPDGSVTRTLIKQLTVVAQFMSLAENETEVLDVLSPVVYCLTNPNTDYTSIDDSSSSS